MDAADQLRDVLRQTASIRLIDAPTPMRTSILAFMATDERSASLQGLSSDLDARGFRTSLYALPAGVVPGERPFMRLSPSRHFSGENMVKVKAVIEEALRNG